ncbi:MAG: CCA tRNA nucleotidyltransferase [Christensenellales bacterium]|jgi:tRNA nucleotidyltransferase (CCA-adding enzyme)
MRLDVPNILQAAGKCFSPDVLFAVGGLVRNTLLGQKGGDLDVCSGLTPEEVSARLQGSPHVRVVPKAVAFGTVELHLWHDDRPYVLEHTTFRRDSYPRSGAHRPDHVAFTIDLREDALRRDFSVNALYLNCTTGEIVDPLGGISDIQKRMLRTANAPARTLGEDGLRILRMVRFACELNFGIETELYHYAGQYVHYLGDIAKERIKDEFSKILLSDARYPGLNNPKAHKRGLFLLHTLGAYAFILPCLLPGVGVRQKAQYHAYDVFNHLLHAAAAAPADLCVRLAALLHDVGKPTALLESGRMYGHDEISARIAREALQELRFSRAVIDRVCLLIRNHMFDLNGRAKPATIRFMLSSLGREAAAQLIALRRADVIGSGRTGFVPTADAWQRELDYMIEHDMPFHVNELALNGSDIMRHAGIPPGKEIARIKHILLKHCLRKPGRNTKEHLLRVLRGIH